jgi:AcrR family transcriptional regulator
MDEIAATAGLTKRTLYYHFDSKDQLVGAVLDNQNELTLRRFQSWIDPHSRTSADFTDNLFKKLAVWAGGPGWTGSGYTRLALELADLPGHPARLTASQHKRAIETWLSQQFRLRGADNSDQMAQSIALLLEGAMTLALVHGDASYIEVARTNARMLLENQVS